MSDRCTGHCCRRLSLPFSPAELVEARDAMLAYDAWHDAARAELSATGAVCDATVEARPDGRQYTDIVQIADMLVYLGYEPEGAMVDASRDPAKSVHMYRCKNVLPNGDCGIYAQRPGMCRRYPNGQRCRYVACTWDAVHAAQPLDQDAYAPFDDTWEPDPVEVTVQAYHTRQLQARLEAEGDEGDVEDDQDGGGPSPPP